jgi:AraC-like DNA-binding protein
MMRYQQIRPSPAVARFVEFYWTLEDDAPGDSLQRILPDGRGCLVLNFASPYARYCNNAWQLQPRSFLVGQITGPLVLRPSGPMAMLGIQFRPQGAAELFAAPMGELNDHAVMLDAVCPGLARHLEPVMDFDTPGQAVFAVDGLLSQFAERSEASADAALSFAVAALGRSHGLARIRHLAERVGWSTRQLQRRFKAVVGISPKLFARMQRFQAVLRATDGREADWVTAAVHSGYYDQSHLIRDFREFAGKPPTGLLDQELDLNRRFVQGQAMSHSSKTGGRATV